MERLKAAEKGNATCVSIEGTEIIYNCLTLLNRTGQLVLTSHCVDLCSPLKNWNIEINQIYFGPKI
jgi:hypothetical protein